MKYAWLTKHKRLFPAAVICHVLNVSTSGYYDSIKRQPSAQHVRRKSIAQAAACSYFESQRIYGHRKVHMDLVEEGVACCRETVRRIMREIGLYSRIKRKFVVTTNSKHALSIAENILSRDFTAEAPNLKWVADITYIPTKTGWLYLAIVMDLFSRRIDLLRFDMYSRNAMYPYQFYLRRHPYCTKKPQCLGHKWSDRRGRDRRTM